MPFNIIRNDITQLETDAIVNAANVHLKEGGGVCGAIFAVAGKEKLQKACDRIGGCNVGEAVITKGFDLKANYIIHTVGPVYGKDPLNEENQLYSCYFNSLELAKRKRLKSIAFPLISSGIYGYPKAEAIKIATRAIKDFLAENEMTVFLVVYDKSAFGISEKLFSNVASYIDDRMVKKERRRTESYSSFGFSKALAEDDACLPDFLAAPKPSMSANPKKSLDDFLNIKAETFSEMLFRLIDQKGYTDVEVYKRANIDRKLFSKMRKKDYVPKKVTVFALVIALRLNMADAKKLLSRAGFAFNESSKFDLIIEYFIENENYDIFEINETLFAFEQPLIGA